MSQPATVPAFQIIDGKCNICNKQFKDDQLNDANKDNHIASKRHRKAETKLQDAIGKNEQRERKDKGRFVLSMSTFASCSECNFETGTGSFHGLRYGWENDKCNICNNAQRAAIDKLHYQQTLTSNNTNNANKFWSLFNGFRKYRQSGSCIRFFIELHVLCHCRAEINKPFHRTGKPDYCSNCPVPDHHIYLYSLTVNELYSIYNKYKNKIKDKEITREFDFFFKYYQYGDIIDYSGYRNCTTYAIGFGAKNDSKHNVGNTMELRFVPYFMEYGMGIPIEFGDRPYNYDMGGYYGRYTLIDPLRMILNKDQKLNNDKYAYIRLLKEIVQRQKQPNYKSDYSDIQYKIDVTKFPNEYIWFGFTKWIDRQKLFEYDKWDKENHLTDNNWSEWNNKRHDKFGVDAESLNELYVTVRDWVRVYDIKERERKYRIKHYLLSIDCILNTEIIEIITELVVDNTYSDLSVDIQKWNNGEFC